jgi:hypothetical protein
MAYHHSIYELLVVFLPLSEDVLTVLAEMGKRGIDHALG